MDAKLVKGVIVPLFMPINGEEEIREEALRRQVGYVIDGGVSGILLFGCEGEAYALEPEEQEKALEIVLDGAGGRIPVYAVVGAAATRRCIKEAQAAYARGVQGIFLCQPMGITPGEGELFSHYQAVAASVPDLPVLISHNPKAGYGIRPEMAIRLAKETGNLAGISDSSGDIGRLCEYIRLAKDREFSVLVGEDAVIMPGLAAGASGCVAATANVLPNFVCDIYRRYMAGDLEGARKAQYRLTPVKNAMDLAGVPGGVKDVANLLGMEAGMPCLPYQCSSGEVLGRMRRILEEEGII